MSRFQMVSDKLATICLDLKWFGFPISDPTQNPDHLQPNLFWTIQNTDWVGFQIPTVLQKKKQEAVYAQ